MNDQQNEIKEEIKLEGCPACQRTVSSQAMSCPHCGHPLKQKKAEHIPPIQSMPAKQGLGFWGVFFAIVLAIVVMSLV